MYESDRGIEELLRRLGPPGDADSLEQSDAVCARHPSAVTPRGVDDFVLADRSDHGEGSETKHGVHGESIRPSPYSVGIEWLAEHMRQFVDLHPDWEDAVGSLASFLARTDETDD